MFTPGGHIDLFTFAGLRGGGKGGGGGGGATPIAPTVLTDPVSGKSFTQSNNPLDTIFGAKGQPSAQDQLNAEIDQRKQQEATDAAAKQATTDAANAADESSFQTRRQQAYNDALQSTIRSFQLQGADPNQYMASDITPALQRQFNSIQDRDPNPAAAFPTSLGDTIVNSVLSGKRTQASNALNQVFTPTYANNLIPDSAIGSSIDDILNEQFNPLQSQLQNAQKRGTLTDAGYSAALDALNQKRSGAQATVQNLGQTILGTDRSGINDIISGARGDVANLGLADTFDPSTYTGKANTLATGDLANFGGALRNAVGDTKFADIQSLINAGGAVQGENNPTVANPTGLAGGAPDDPLATTKRGLGTVGAF